ncbi:hypothetical protein TcBrA4_0039830 [Trypanosoma cruzi]|nr:hypothetical protein TcBrA4_0039830 [Trypanosoma cruzi]
MARRVQYQAVTAGSPATLTHRPVATPRRKRREGWTGGFVELGVKLGAAAMLYLNGTPVNIAGGRRRTDTTQPQSLMHRPTPWYKKAIEQHPADRQCAV